MVYAIEVVIAVSLILGLLTRLSSVLGVAMAINLWLGLYSAPGEWPWTYMFLVVIELIYLLDPPGRIALALTHSFGAARALRADPCSRWSLEPSRAARFSLMF